MENIKRILGNVSGGNILDVGTGDGAFIKVLIEHLKEFENIIGIDSDPAVLINARQAVQSDRVTFIPMTGEELLYPDNNFDTISISNSLHHLNDISKTLKEMLRVLKPGGYFIINELICDELNEKQMTHQLFHQFQADIDMILGTTHNKTMSKQEIIDIAGNLGLLLCDSTVHINEIFNRYVNVDIFASRYLEYLKKLEGYPDYERFHREYEQLKIRLYEVGVEFTPQLLLLGSKAVS